MTALDFTKTQLAVYFVVFLLSVDSLNPVKVLCHVFPGVQQWHLATLSLLLTVYVFFAQFKQLLYFAVKIFFHSILSIFFREVEVIGKKNIPQHGPVIFTINHANQFVDAVMVLSTCQRNVSYLMAEASYKRPVIGHIAYALGKCVQQGFYHEGGPRPVSQWSLSYLVRVLSGVVPVKRAQDDARRGTGKIHMTLEEKGETKTIAVKGVGTKFLEEKLNRGDKIRPPGTAAGFKVLSVDSDTALTLDASMAEDDYSVPDDQPMEYDVLKKVDTHVVFEKVLERLAAGGSVGIFPEGGSHDRTELLPLKVGIALIAYSALDRDGINIPIVPVGLSYFRAHRWRGKAVVEYGKPTMINPATLDDYRAGGDRKKTACNKLLENIESAMRSVIVSAPDYDTLETIHTARRLYQKDKAPLDAGERQNLSRRFAEGYKRLLLMTNGNPPPEWRELQNRIIAYRKELKELGIRDYQVPAIVEEHLDEPIENVDTDKTLGFFNILYQIIHLFGLLALAAVPILFLNLPVGLLAGIYAERRRKKALAKSKVKVKGYDVMMTEKIMFCSKFYSNCVVCYPRGATPHQASTCFRSRDGARSLDLLRHLVDFLH